MKEKKQIINLSVNASFLALILIITCNYAYANKEKSCITLPNGECAFHSDGSPQRCTIENSIGLCTNIKGKCKCVTGPKDCIGYENLFPGISCYETDGSRLACPIGRIVELEHGVFSGTIYCCCNDNNVKPVIKDKKEDDSSLIDSSTKMLARP